VKLYAVYNGYQGYEPVHVMVVADSEERAVQLASAELKKEATVNGKPIYEEDYWTELEANCLFDPEIDTKESVSDVIS